MFNSFGIAEDYKTKHKCLVTAVNVHFYYKIHIEKSLFAAVGGRFTFTICSYFHRTGIVVPLYSHATKSTPTPSHHPPNTQNHSTHLVGQNLTISLPKLTTQNHNKTPPLHTLSPLPYLTTLLHPKPNKSNTNKQNIT